MKKVIILFVFVFWSSLLISQTMSEKMVVRFMGIPVDGSKSEMISKLKKKGFTYNYKDDELYGTFNDSDVVLSVQEVKGKVWRIMVCDKYLTDSETTIIRRFNRLLRQFENNEKYTSLFANNSLIDDSEDISYEMIVHNKRYEAYFHQNMTDDVESDCFNDTVYMEKWLFDTYTEKELDSLRTISASEEEFFGKLYSKFFATHYLEFIEHNTVWFSIFETRGHYGIVLFYENDYNESKGEDL